MGKTIACIGTLDTKGKELGFIADILRKRGHYPLIIDIGILGDPGIDPDITRKDIAKAASTTMEDILEIGDQGECAAKMTIGLVEKIMGLYDSGKLDGIISIGGGMGTSMATAAMKELPVGFPKLMVSIRIGQPSSSVEHFVGTKDVTLMPTVCDIQGLNRLTRKILANAAGSIAGMVESSGIDDAPGKPLIVMSENGTTTKCGMQVKQALEDKGYEVIIFAGAGIGGMCQEEFIKEYPVNGVIELTVYEVIGELLGATSKSGPHRLEAAGAKGIIQLITPGSADFVAFAGLEGVPARYKDRHLLTHNPQSILMRVNSDEFRRAAQIIADKLNRAKGPVQVLIPTRGFSDVDREGKPFYDLETDRVLIDALKRHLAASIPVREVDAHMNEKAFADEVIREFLQMASRV